MAVRVAPARSDSPGPHSPLFPALSWMRPARAKQRVNEEQIWIGECLLRRVGRRCTEGLIGKRAAKRARMRAATAALLLF